MPTSTCSRLLTPSVDFAALVKQPNAYEVPSRCYPTTYRIRYEAAASEYVIRGANSLV